MPQISFLKPLEQPLGQRRFLAELEQCLASPGFSTFCFSVAFAKMGPFVRLAQQFEQWRTEGKSIRAIFGIDHLGTSQQVLKFALENFDQVYVTHVDFTQSSRVTFHPKQYLFFGEGSAVCYVGSHNMTTGGTETNFEAGVRIDMTRPQDETTFQEALSAWLSLLPSDEVSTLELTSDLLEALIVRNLLLDESTSLRANSRGDANVSATSIPARLFPTLPLKPASALPRDRGPKSKTPPDHVVPQLEVIESLPTIRPAAPETFLIQIIPHHNGEVLLSYNAVQQNPEFFGYPFTGFTTPKKLHNNPYPQRVPDPIVKVFIYDETGALSFTAPEFGLNTVDYTSKKEIRITFPPEVISRIPPYSIMSMEKSPYPSVDYIIRIYAPGSDAFNKHLSACNQSLPSGGKAIARRMGWL